MQVLVTSTPGLGHRLPMVPLVRELRAWGHDVRWVGGPERFDELAALGVQVRAAGMLERDRQRLLAERHPDVATVPPAQRQRTAFPRVFAEIAAGEMLEPVRAAIADQRPDVVLHDAAELAAPLAAAEAGIPSVCHGYGQIVPEAAVREAGDVLRHRWLAAGTEPDAYAGSYRHLYIDIYPPSLRDADLAHVPRVQASRPAEGTPASGSTVYVTFGTLFNQDHGLLRDAVLAAATSADHVLVTLGHEQDPAVLGSVPSNVRVEAFVAQADVLPQCAAVVCHGGSGTVLAALAHGIPVVCVPQGADQYANAANVARVGAGAVATRADMFPDALEHVLATPGARDAARALAAEIAAMPGPSEVALAIEKVASGWVSDPPVAAP